MNVSCKIREWNTSVNKHAWTEERKKIKFKTKEKDDNSLYETKLRSKVYCSTSNLSRDVVVVFLRIVRWVASFPCNHVTFNWSRPMNEHERRNDALVSREWRVHLTTDKREKVIVKRVGLCRNVITAAVFSCRSIENGISVRYTLKSDRFNI